VASKADEVKRVVTRIAQRRGRRGAAVFSAGADARRARFAVAAAALCLLALVATQATHAATYKWVDDKGVVHYTDKIPPEALNKGNVVLDKNGVPIKRNDPPPTPEQRKARDAEEARQQQLAKERELVDRRDRALLSTYTMESEIELARKRALTTIDAQVQSSTSYSTTLNKRRVELEKQKAQLGDKPLPTVLERELVNITAELGKQDQLLAAKQKEIAVVNARYDADKKRWKDLRLATEAQMSGGTNVVPTSQK
jgi:Domain of unknown function (DUF4124)